MISFFKKIRVGENTQCAEKLEFIEDK